MVLTTVCYELERRRWRRAQVRRWKKRRNCGAVGRVTALLLKLCLLAAILAEACWFAAPYITVERLNEVREMDGSEPGPAATRRGIRLRLDDGEISLFEVEEQAAPPSD